MLINFYSEKNASGEIEQRNEKSGRKIEQQKEKSGRKIERRKEIEKSSGKKAER